MAEDSETAAAGRGTASQGSEGQGTAGRATPTDGPGGASGPDPTAVSRLRAWLIAARPQTLPAAAAPLLVGAGLAIDRGVFAPVPVLVAFVSASFIQIGTNFANDYFDALSGADSADRTGFTRATASGLLSPTAMRRGAAVAFGLAILTGGYLVAVGGLPILLIGLASVVAGVAYTGGPWPFGYKGLGDLFVFVFFGVVAVTGTYYVQVAADSAALFPVAPPAGALPTDALLASLPVGALATAILVVNNLRDRESDAAAGKRTLAVRLGARATRVEYLALLAVAFLVPVAFATGLGYGRMALLPLLAVPYAALVSHTVLTEEGAVLNEALTNTGRLLLAHAALFAAGLAA